MRLYSNVLRGKDYRALAPRLGTREVNISNQHADDKGLAEVTPKPNRTNVKQGTSANALRPAQAKLRDTSPEVKEQIHSGGHIHAVCD